MGQIIVIPRWLQIEKRGEIFYSSMATKKDEPENNFNPQVAKSMEEEWETDKKFKPIMTTDREKGDRK